MLVSVMAVFAAIVASVGVVVVGGAGFLAFSWAYEQISRLQARVVALEKARAAAVAPAPVAAPVAPVAAAPVAADAPDAPTEEAARPSAAPAPEKPAPKVRPALAPRPPSPPTPAFELPSIERIAAVFAAVLGGLTLLLGLVLFVAVALSRGWLGPGARMLAAFVGSGGLRIAGDLARRRSPWVAPALAGAGFVGVLASLYATHAVYGFLGGTTATVAMVGACAVAGLSAVRHDDRLAAHLSLVGALLTPVLLSTGEDRAVAFFVYLTGVTAATVATAARKGWPDLVLVAAAGVGVLHIGWAVSWFDRAHVTVALASILALSVPFGVAASFGRARVAATLPLAVAPLLAMPWLVPIAPWFTDASTGVSVPQPALGLPWRQAVALPLLVAPLWSVGRRRAWPWLALVGTTLAAFLLLWWTSAWAIVADVDAGVGLFAAVWVLAVAAALHVGARPTSAGVSPVPFVAGLFAALAFTTRLPAEGLDSLAVAGVTGALVVAAWALVPRGTTTGLLGAVGGAGLFLLWASVARLPEFGLPWLGAAWFGLDNTWATLDGWGAWRVSAWGPALAALAALGIAPLGVRWAAQDRGWALGASALAPLVIGPALAAQWAMSVGRPGLGLVPLGLGAVAALGAQVTVRLHGNTRADAVPAAFVLVALTGVTAAIPLELEKGWMSTALAIELVMVAGLARVYTHGLVRATVGPLAAAVAIRLLANPWALSYEVGGWPILNWTLYTWGAPTLAVATAAVVYRGTWAALPAHQRLPAEDWVPVALGLLAVALGFAFVNVEVSHAFQPGRELSLHGENLLQGMVRSLSWGAYGLFVLGVGWAGTSRWLRLVGFGTVLLATAKVFLVDLWALSGFVRVGSVLGLGLFLILAALLFERIVLRQPAKEAP